MDSNSEYKVGALADLISEGGGGKTLSMASLFTTDKKQKEAAIVTQVEKVEKTNKKVEVVRPWRVDSTRRCGVFVDGK